MVIVIHVLSAALALVLGAALFTRSKRLPFHPRFGTLYHWTMLVVCVSALAVSAMRGRAVVFTYLAPPSYMLALVGYVSGARRWSGWLRWHIGAQSGSYVALLTGLAVQSVPKLLPAGLLATHPQLIIWTLLLLPTLLAQPLIARTQARWTRRGTARETMVREAA